MHPTIQYQLARTIAAFDNSVRLGREAGSCERFVLALGDASDARVLGDDLVAELRRSAPHLD